MINRVKNYMELKDASALTFSEKREISYVQVLNAWLKKVSDVEQGRKGPPVMGG